MKNFNVQNLILTIMIAVVYAAHMRHLTTCTHSNLLDTIHCLAGKMLNNGTWHELVPNPRGENGTKCVSEFFCRAEKALENLRKKNIGDEAKNQTEILIRNLKQYNKKKNITKCELKVNRTYRAKDLLSDIQECAIHHGKKN